MLWSSALARMNICVVVQRDSGVDVQMNMFDRWSFEFELVFAKLVFELAFEERILLRIENSVWLSSLESCWNSSVQLKAARSVRSHMGG